MTERFLEGVRSCIQRYAHAAEKAELDQGERLVKEIHHFCCLIADKNNGTGIAPLRETARKLAGLHEEARGCDEVASALCDFGAGFALLRGGAFHETVAQFDRIPQGQCESSRTIELAACCFGCVAASLGGELGHAHARLSRAKRLIEEGAGAITCLQAGRSVDSV